MFLEKKYNLLLKFLEKCHSITVDYMDLINVFLNKNKNITSDELFNIEDFLMQLDIIRLKLKDSIFMLKKIELERNEKITFLSAKEKDDIYVDLNNSIIDFFKK